MDWSSVPVEATGAEPLGFAPSCRVPGRLPAISMAFQPIVDCGARTVFGFEALVRGSRRHESAAAILAQRTRVGWRRFDFNCHTRAILLAARLGLRASKQRLAMNFPASAFAAADDCVQTVLELADQAGLDRGQLIFEITEGEPITAEVRRGFRALSRSGALTAIDDFGAGFSGLAALAELRPGIVKLDRRLIHGVSRNSRRMAIVRAVVGLCAELGAQLIAEGVESADDFAALSALGITLFQGFYFARPAFESLPLVRWPG